VCDVYVSDQGLPGVVLLPRGDASAAQAVPGPWGAPAGLFVDGASKDLYVADGSSVVLLAGGTGAPAYVGGQGAFSAVRDVYRDAQGTVWVVDAGAAAVFRVSPEGVVSPFTVASAPWVSPHAVTVTAAGSVYVSDFGAGVVVSVSAWGSGEASVVGAGVLSQPAGLYFAEGTQELLVAEFNNMIVYAFAADGSGSVRHVAEYPGIGERPVDVGGAPWGAVLVAAQNAGGVYATATGAGLGGTWSNAQGLWMDCAPAASPSASPSVSPSPSVTPSVSASVSASASPSDSPSASPSGSTTPSDTPSPMRPGGQASPSNEPLSKVSSESSGLSLFHF
jgi:hypothetical protein